MLKAASKALENKWFNEVLPLVLGALLLMILTSVPLAAMSLVTFLSLNLLLSLLVFRYLYDIMLLKRHAYLSMLTQSNSPWRVRLWQSGLATLFTALSAFLVTYGIWVAVAQLSWQEGGILTASLLSFGLLRMTLRGWVGRHITAAYQGISLIRLSHWLNVAVLCIGLLIAHYWWLEVPDTRALSLVDAMSQAYQQQAAASQLKLPGILVGINAALMTGAWHVTQVLALNAPWWITILAWCGVVLGLAIQASMIWLPILGIYSSFTSIICSAHSESTKPPRRAQPLVYSWPVVACVVVISIWWLESDPKLPNWVDAIRAEKPSHLVHAGASTQARCTEDVVAEQQRAFEAQTSVLRQRQYPQLQAQADQLIAAHVTQAFAASQVAIDAFLDWNFSLPGQYTQLFMLVNAGLKGHEFEQQLNTKLEEQINQHVQPALVEQSAHLDENLRELIAAGIREYNQQLTIALQTTIQHHTLCWNVSPIQLNVEHIMHKSAVGAGVVPGLTLMSRALAPGSALLARAGTRRVIAMLSGRVTVRAASSGAAAGVGSVCGPLCMLVAGAATWIGTDIALNAADEAMYRDTLKAQLMNAVEAQQQHLTDTLQNEVSQWLVLIFNEVEAEQNARFNVSREVSRDSKPN